VTVEERVGRILAEMTEDLRPLPDPHGRVRAGLRRRRRRRLTAIGLAALTVLSASAVAWAGGPDRRVDDPAVREREQGWARVMEWSRRLMDSPPRGAVAADAAYVGAVEEKVLEEYRRGRTGQDSSEARVLFADDVGPYRIALVALVRAVQKPDVPPAASTWLIGRKGAGAGELAGNVRATSDGLQPYDEFEGYEPEISQERVHVAVAPSECVFLAAPLPLVNDWTAEPTGSYVVRTEPRPEWWRVDCDGLVKMKKPGPGGHDAGSLSDGEMASLVSTVRHGPGVADWRTPISLFAAGAGWAASDLPHAIWAGRISGTVAGPGGSYDGRAAVLAAPAPGGGWVGEVQITYDKADPVSGGTSTAVRFTTRADPTAPETPLLIPLGAGGEARNLLVIAPVWGTGNLAWADGVAVASRSGAQVATAPIVNGTAVLPVTVTPDLEVRLEGSAGKIDDLTIGVDQVLPVIQVSAWDI
jgi:hypothetical protein